MIYIRKLFTQDLRDGKQIAFPKEPSLSFFNFDYPNKESDRAIEFCYKADFSQNNQFDGKIIQTRLYSATSEARIDGELKAFLRDELVVSIDDFVLFYNEGKAFDKFTVKVVKKTDELYSLVLRLTDSKNHTILVNENSLQEDDLAKRRLLESVQRNRILFGAPGTGKSKTLNDDADKIFVRTALSKEERAKLFKKSLFCASNYYTYVGNNILDLHHFDVFAEESLKILKGKLSELRLLKKAANAEPLKTALENQCSALNAYVKFFEIISSAPIERVTFHPNYSFAQFVGSYKPVQNGKDISYSYVSGPFVRTLVKALNNPKQDYLLIIEEINRANVAAVFGDVFQLLDRKDGVSEYPVAASEDIKRYLKDNGIADCNELKIPSNMYIWATMNSADQGVFPMDTAFKRRWEFEYIGIDKNETWDYTIPLPNGESINWNVLRKAINSSLKKIASVNEDKLLGPYFLSKAVLEDANKWNSEQDSEEKQKAVEKFLNTFKSKVLMYLYEDVCKMRPGDVFKIKLEDGQTRLHYSDICDAFDLNGIKIFGFEKADIEDKYKQKI